jgi:hypothetical protein
VITLAILPPAPRAPFPMAAFSRTLAFATLLACSAFAAPPAGLATALEYLRDQRSYSWEVINGDPGPVAQQFQTRRGTMTTVHQSMFPHIKGKIARNGDMLIVREWPDGLKLETAIFADGSMITNTPEGWMTDREILTAQAEERIRSQTPTPRVLWLRRADRPDVSRPDQELVPLLKSNSAFDYNGESYIANIRSRSGDPAQPNTDASEPAIDVTLTLNVRNGMVRDYEVKIDTTRRTRARYNVPISEQRLVILSYLPVSRIDIPDEARAKLTASRAAGASSRPNEGK